LLKDFRISVAILWLVSSLASTALFAQNSASAQQPVLLSVRTAHWMGYTEPDFSGFYFDVLRAVYTKPEYEFDFKIVSFPASLKMLEGGGADIVLGVYNNELRKGYFSDLPVEREVLAAVMTPERAVSWKGTESLASLRVGSIEGYAFEGRLPVSAHYREFESIDLMLRMLQVGRLDVILDYRPDLEHYMEKLDLPFVIKGDLPQSAIYFAFREDTRGLALKKHFDRRFKELLDKGKVWELLLNALGQEDAEEAFPFICSNGKCSEMPELLKH